MILLISILIYAKSAIGNGALIRFSKWKDRMGDYNKGW